MTRAIEPRSHLGEARHGIATALTVVVFPLVVVIGFIKTEFGAGTFPVSNKARQQNLVGVVG
jgi:hypothetical protein